MPYLVISYILELQYISQIFKNCNIIPVSTTTPTGFTCPAGAMPVRFDRFGNGNSEVDYKIEAVESDNTTSNVGPTVLKPSGGNGLCRYGPVNLIIKLTPKPRSSDMFISLRVKGATSVSFMYTFGSRSSSPYTVSFYYHTGTGTTIFDLHADGHT